MKKNSELFYCKNYKCYLSPKACIKRQELVEKDKRGNSARATFLGCITCEQGKEIKEGMPMKEKFRKRVVLFGYCKECRWFEPYPLLSDEKGKAKAGACKRRSPSSTGFPTVLAMEWCGDFELRRKQNE